MARNKEYNTQNVLDTATAAFINKGFKGVSINDLVKATKLNKHSMYQEFGSKEGLFCECINHYVQTVYRDFGHVLRRQPLGLKNIEDFFRRRIDYAYSAHGDGCLLVTTVVEKEQVEAVVLDRVQHHWTLQKADFQLCLSAAQDQGDIPKDADIKVLSNTLFCFLIGMVVIIKGGSDRESVEKMLAMTLASIENKG
ncbi:TetR/AcrR family transcriptional regulator [Desulfoluna sp.]|uniref:TetR/AcrR family transcriptional regulator n=1 Tax=Desulfoluna sp. TaxID=2045199 RepID=UPI00262D9D18|nr:TetR/AcrR family transcriptional regulator [Desulfoluna sp.]